MPSDCTPRSLAFLILKSPGNFAPTVATATFMPAAALLAPQTICRFSSPPTLTWQTPSLSASGCCSRDTISPTTTPVNNGAAISTESTSRPAILSWSASSCVVMSGLTHSRNQLSLKRILLPYFQIYFFTTWNTKSTKSHIVLPTQTNQITLCAL